jgi:DNA replication protein DnaC
MVRHDVEIGHPLFGKMARCPNNPQSQDEQLLNRLRRTGNLEAFKEKSFDNFTINEMHKPIERESLVYALMSAKRFAEQLDGWLLLEGSYGCGKTHLAAAVANARLDKGDNVLFITAPDLLDHLRSAYAPNSESGYDDLFDRVRNVGLLILDDLGVENPSPWAQEKLFQLLNHRYTKNLATIITTNNDIDRLDPRIRSRLLDVELVTRIKVVAPDYRSLSLNQQTQLQTSLNKYLSYTFSTFDVENHLMPQERDGLYKAVNTAWQYANSPQGWAILYGTYGSGKTHLAASIGHRRLEMGDDVMFITVPDLMDYLRVSFSPNSSVSFEKRFNDVKNISFLILDDLNTETASNWAREKLFQLLDFRYVAQLPTVITTSKALDEIDERIQTRLLDDRICAHLVITARPYTVRRRERL